MPKSKRSSNARRFALGSPGRFKEREYSEQIPGALERGSPGMLIKTGEEIKNMRHLLIATMTATLTLPPMPAQKIENETASRERVVRVQTAMNHLTVIEVGEPVTTVAVGSPQSFKVERRENKVFIQPLDLERLRRTDS